jgi:eukaryotic-like serine/threonine-protein kinase
LNATVADGRYRIERTVGRGAMAVVYLARDQELQRLVALKILSEELGADEGVRTRFLREAKLASRLSHPNVVRIYDANAAGAQLFIVMEHVPGSTLADSGKLPYRDAVRLVLQACAGLQHAHEAGLVHRDVKPANLLLREDGVVKIADFGIARAADTTQLTKQGVILGTAAYLAPEQAAGENVGPAADIYSLGAVLYELLTGRPPYQFESLAELGELQSEGVIVPPRDLEPAIPPEVEAAMMRALAREPRFRPNSAADFAQELAAVTDEAPTLPLQATAFAEPGHARSYRSTTRKRRWILAAAATAALAIVGVILAVTLSGHGDSSSPPPRVAPISGPSRGAGPADEARNLSAWLSAHSR